MEPIYTNAEIEAEVYRRLMPIMHLGLEETHNVEQKDIVINAIRSIKAEIEKSKDWLDK